MNEAKLKQFIDDKELVRAVKEYLLETEQNIDLKLDNENLGANIRAFELAKKIIKESFYQLNKFRKVEDKKYKLNEAR